MCGIAGIIRFEPSPSLKQQLSGATHLLMHRGLESPVCWSNVENTVGLGHCRLSIIDPDPRSSQPFYYLNRYRIIHNGELYNYLEIRSTLEKKGFSFYTQSDTEVIVAAYHAYGDQCVHQFDGMFAFAIWDEKEHMLFSARDRFGEKPFYYYWDQHQFLLASEMKALWSMGAPKEVNPSMLYNFLTISYTCNPSHPSETFYNSIYKLPAASILKIGIENKEPVIEKYCQVFPQINNSITDATAIEQFRHLFTASMQKRLRSDVKIGSSLSGGLDSSAIVAVCHQLASDHYAHECFTASFPGFDKDESHYAKMLAQQFGLQQHIVTIDTEEITSLMQAAMTHQEEPFTSGSVLAQFKVYEAAKKAGVHVLLDGQGADEILGGYHQYYQWYWLELYRNKQLKKSGELRYAREAGITIPFGLRHKLAAMAPHFSAAIQQGRKARQAHLTPDLDRDFAFTNKRHSFYTTPLHFDLNGALFHNTFVYGLEDLLRLADRNSMAHSVEVRLPFLQHELVEFLFTLPPHLKIREGWTKWLLRTSMSDKLPQSIAWRKDKTGFEPPQQQWMQHKNVIEAIQEGKRKLVSQRILAPHVMDKKIKPHGAHAVDNRDWKYWSASFLFD